MVITLGDVLFNTAKAKLKANGINTLQQLANLLNEYPAYKVSVEGYTDSVGSDDYNQELSERRAEAVQNALMEMGVASNRIQMQGYGEAYPVSSNDDSEGRQLNRRVEIILSDEHGVIAPH